MEKKKIPVIIDCDPGIDDAVALAVAFASPQLDVLAVCSVAGNVSVDKTTRNARAVLATLGVHSHIYQGAGQPLLSGTIHIAENAHGETGLGNFSVPDERLHPLEKPNAIDGMRDILNNSREKVTIIAIGPLTNIALLLRTYPNVKDKIARISLMGGGLTCGNRTPAAEFNIYCDPEAADIVFESGIPIIMAGLDVTYQARMSGRQLKALRDANNPVTDMLVDTLEFYFGETPDMDIANSQDCLHDVVSVMALTHPEVFSGENLCVVVETAGRHCRGYTLADRRPIYKDRKPVKPNCHVLLSLDFEGFHRHLLHTLRSYSAS